MKILLLVVLFSVSFSFFTQAMNFVTNEYIQTTFQIKYNNNVGTAFKPLKTKKYSYHITAEHVISQARSGDTIAVRTNKGWVNIRAIKVLHNSKQDTSLFVFDGKNSPVAFQNSMDVGGLMYSQDVFILGFPLGIAPIIDKIGEQKQLVPFPLVKKGVVSAIVFKESQQPPSNIYVDMHINQGFSGGPALFYDQRVKKMKIFGVVSSFRKDEINGKLIEANSGIGIVRAISFARELIIQAQKELKDDAILK